MRDRQPLVILDRDGVINEDSDDYIKSPDEFIPLPGSIDAIADLCRAGFRIAIATNQSGIARGLYSPATLELIHDKLRREVEAAGGTLPAIFHCPHGPDDGCDCRKPRPGLLHQIAARFDRDLEGVPFVGDSARDLEAAAAVGAQPMLVRTGYGRNTERGLAEKSAIPVFDDLRDAARSIISAARETTP